MNQTTPTTHAARTPRRKRTAPRRGVGVHPANPPKCFVCRHYITARQAWKKYTSPPDSEFGRYSFLVHEHCALEAK